MGSPCIRRIELKRAEASLGPSHAGPVNTVPVPAPPDRQPSAGNLAAMEGGRSLLVVAGAAVAVAAAAWVWRREQQVGQGLPGCYWKRFRVL